MSATEFLIGAENPNQFGEREGFLLVVVEAEQRHHHSSSNIVETEREFFGNQAPILVAVDRITCLESLVAIRSAQEQTSWPKCTECPFLRAPAKRCIKI